MMGSLRTCPNPQALVDCCVASLRRDKDRVARVALGAASEQWFNTELFLSLNFDAPQLFEDGVWAQPEHQKIDLAIVCGTYPNFDICGYIESKCVFPNGLHVEPIQKLARQLNRDANGQILAVPRIGMIFSCWSTYSRNQNYQVFQTRVEEAIKNVFPVHTCTRCSPISITGQLKFQWQQDPVIVEVALHPIIIMPTTPV